MSSPPDQGSSVPPQETTGGYSPPDTQRRLLSLEAKVHALEGRWSSVAAKDDVSNAKLWMVLAFVGIGTSVVSAFISLIALFVRLNN